ncbi:DUF1559 family PulG-like putative transporter [Anatilimnocola floriformis]|uniref:DUF1559 family PulG-like putative transporter n=1 Tax=Anatilimnocola floriformis TaxID=2948575 RepID=UPI0020C20256|nr:DUF1559 domain-containing protein [Anatilimnocola floriformis]
MHKWLSVFLFLIPTILTAQESPLAPVAPLLDSQTCAVLRVDLGKIDAAAALQFLANVVGEGHAADEIKATAPKAQGFLATLREYGAQDAYVILSLADFPESPPPIVLTLKPAASNEDLLATHLKPLTVAPYDHRLRQKNLLIFGSARTIERVRENKPVERPDLAAAMTNVASAPVQIAAAIPADVQRVVRELVGKLPPEVGGGQGQDLLDALQWMSVALEPPPKLSLKWTIQSKTEAAAAGLRPRILAGINLAGDQAKLKELMPDFAELAIRLTPAVKGDRLELNLAGADIEPLVKQLQAGPLKLMRSAAGQAQSMNNLKQIALAMHNYADANGKFPGAASLSKDGKPLLSWRVHILPFVEQEALFKEFHLDEPWDSEHNRKLIPFMPEIYLDPVHPEIAVVGKTIYAVPVGEKSAFSVPGGIKFASIVDGTSNTIMTVTLPAESAVIWTKPDDWNFDPKDPAAGLLDGKRTKFLTAFCDGSVRTLPATIDRKDLRRLVQMNDGEVIDNRY